MVKAAALYIVIIIALVIGVLCSSLIVTAYFYKAQYQKKFRYDQLENNLTSGINILLASPDSIYAEAKPFNLFNGDADSVILHQIPWGIYNIGIVKAFIQKDTLYRVFSTGAAVDSSKWAVLYLVDHDRPFSLSGQTTIRGNAFIPKAGVQEAYMNNQAYKGDKRLIIGTKHNSEQKLPVLNQTNLDKLQAFFQTALSGDSLIRKDTESVSFLQPTRFYNFKKKVCTLDKETLSGNITLLSDTTVIIDSTVILKNILVYAKSIIVKPGFRGKAQLFATDSIRVDSNCHFSYPSSLGILDFRAKTSNTVHKLTIGNNTEIEGGIFTYEKTANDVQPLVAFGKNAVITGQIYSQGILELKDHATINGSVFTNQLIYQHMGNLYENYLINAIIDSKALSKYYLSSGFFPVSGNRKKILQWLEIN